METDRLSWMGTMDALVGRKRTVLTAAVVSAALWAAGCGGNGRSSTETHTRNPVPGRSSSLGPQKPKAVLTFDDLGGGSSIIEVFPGVRSTPADEQYNGTYSDGDRVSAVCKTNGRTVHSDPSVGERSRSSHEWIRIIGAPGVSQYATAVYIEHPRRLLQQLPDC